MIIAERARFLTKRLAERGTELERLRADNGRLRDRIAKLDTELSGWIDLAEKWQDERDTMRKALRAAGILEEGEKG